MFLSILFLPIKNITPKTLAKGDTAISEGTNSMSCGSIFSTLRLISQMASGDGNIQELSKVSTGLGMVECIIWGIIDFLLEMAWFVAALMIMISGIKYMGSAGNPGARESATKSLSSSVLGFASILMVYAVFNFFLSYIEYNAFVNNFINKL